MSLNKLVRSLLFAMVALTISLPGQAGMVATAQVQDSGVAIQLGDMLQQRDWLEEQLVIGGVSEVDAVSRVAAMTDVEITEIYQRIDKAPVGGTDFLIIALIVFAVLEITGYIDVIPEK